MEGDKVKLTTSDNIDFWYNNYFIASGYQKISNDQEGGKRNVFYLNKVSF
jgi:regulation of enolase protein 1 (concanavalin A-like superfamily)